MNLYISDITLRGSANNLDNARLRQQMLWIVQVLSNVLQVSDLYTDTLEANSASLNKWNNRYRDYREKILPKKNEKHSLVLWALKSPLYVLFLLDYYECCYDTNASRGNGIQNISLSNMYNVVYIWRRALRGLLPANNMSQLCGLESDLYRNIPIEFDNETDTITAYQKYLIKQWKSDIAEYEKLKDEQAAWKSLSEYKQAKIVKPRLNRKLVWSRGSWGGKSPAFAKDELNALFKELKDARSDCKTQSRTSQLIYGVNEHATRTGAD